MSTPDDHQDDLDPFARDLADRLQAAAAPVTGDRVTRDAVDRRIDQRHRGRRRRQGGLAVVAAAVVVLLGVGMALGAPNESERAGTTGLADGAGGIPATDEPTTTVVCVDGPGSEVGPTACGELPGSTPVTVCEVVPPSTVTIPEPTAEAPPDEPGLTCWPADDPPTTTTSGSPWPDPAPTEGPTSTTETAPETTTAPAAEQPPPSTTAPLGGACTPGPADPDCIDPEGDGSFVNLDGGAACMASPIAGPQCADLDGDGAAGYPDSEG